MAITPASQAGDVSSILIARSKSTMKHKTLLSFFIISSILLISSCAIFIPGYSEYSSAKKYYQKAIEIKPNYANAYINLGTVFKELEQTDKAMNCYIKAIEILPSLSYAHSNLGTIYKELGELEKAISCYTNATT